MSFVVHTVCLRVIDAYELNRMVGVHRCSKTVYGYYPAVELYLLDTATMHSLEVMMSAQVLFTVFHIMANWKEYLGLL